MLLRVLRRDFKICGAVEPVVVQAYKTVSATVVGLIPTLENELLFTNVFIFLLLYQGKRAPLSSASQHVMTQKLIRKWRTES